jgi:hypothetical protein
MEKNWLFIVQTLPIFALLISFSCIKKRDSRESQQWTWRKWLICNSMWMLAFSILFYNNKPNLDETEITCKTIMEVIQLNPNNLELVQMANNIYYNLPKETNGKYQQELNQYVQKLSSP